MTKTLAELRKLVLWENKSLYTNEAFADHEGEISDSSDLGEFGVRLIHK